MKPRRLFVTLEIETDMNLSMLKHAPTWSHWLRPWEADDGGTLCVHQVQVNVAKPERKPKAKAR